MVLRSLLVLTALPGLLAAAPKVDFNRDVRPILSDNCFACHGPDEKQRKAKLRLDTREGALASLDLKKPLESELIRRLLTTDKTEHMPPAVTGKTVTPAQVETLRQWIAEGAEYRGHWAFIAPKRPEAPAAEGWGLNPIDRFTHERMRQENLKPSAEAAKTTLIRRVTLDLTGLPPTPKEIDDYLADASPNAYEKVVDRLLGSVRHGERLALDWLDAARYADTNGYHIDNGRDMTRWREWVIDAFQQNKPYDQFTVEQLAGDLMPNATLEQKIASGFNRNHMINFEGGAIPEEYRTAYIVDRVNTTTTVWLGLTYACCQCHDHKYDPLTQKEFYQLYAYFNSVPENGLDGNRGNAAPMIRVPSKAQEARIALLKKEIAELEASQSRPNPEVSAAQAAWEKAPGVAKTTWKPAVLGNLRAKNGSQLTTGKDGITTAGGPNPAQETYSFTLKTGQKVTALRLETLADESQPARGPGRSTNGNFVMTGFKVTLGDGKALKLRGASADYSQADGVFSVKSLLEPKGKGWAVYPETGKSHHAVFELAEPIAADREITVELQFNSPFANHQFSKFRLSATDSAMPHEGNPYPANIDAILKTDPAKRTPADQQALTTYYQANVSPVLRGLNDKIAGLRKNLAAEENNSATAMVMEEMAKPRDTFMLVRGAYDKRGEKVNPGTPGLLPAQAKDAPANRLSLAKWLVTPEHPLTARVTINRYWQLFFGTGIVKTIEDFGTQGDYPSHPELLDWLAVEFRESGWNLRHMIRLMVTSATYRQSSSVSKELIAKDPENRLMARGPRFRLQAEFIRDQALAVSGLLNGEVGGKSVSPYQPAGLWEELMSRSDGANWTAQSYTQSTGKDLYRRTMYTFWKRTCPPPSLSTLDAPDRETCVVRRSRTNTPLQALVLMNDPTYVEAARKFAERLLTEGGATTEARLNLGFRMVTGRPIQDREAAVLTKVLERQRTRYQNDEKGALKLLSVGESPRDEKIPPGELAAWTMLANTLLNLDETLTRN